MNICWENAPNGAAMPGAPADRVMHASLTLDGATILGSDDPTGDGGPRSGQSGEQFSQPLVGLPVRTGQGNRAIIDGEDELPLR